MKRKALSFVKLHLPARRCAFCRARFAPVRRAQRFCNHSCRSLYWHYHSKS